ncbi:MAG: hypothetical protein AAFY03_12860, partial [Pseudomonadota bacterium]
DKERRDYADIFQEVCRGPEGDKWQQHYDHLASAAFDRSNRAALFHMANVYAPFTQCTRSGSNDARFREALNRSVELGYPPAQYIIGSARMNGGLGETQNVASGLALLDRAFTGGSESAAWALAIIYARGDFGVNVDRDTALEYASIAERGRTLSRSQIGQMWSAFD